MGRVWSAFKLTEFACQCPSVNKRFEAALSSSSAVWQRGKAPLIHNSATGQMMYSTALMMEAEHQYLSHQLVSQIDLRRRKYCQAWVLVATARLQNQDVIWR